MARIRSLFLLLSLLAPSLPADHIALVTEGAMDGTMGLGETRTFEVKLRSSRGSVSGAFVVTISASSGLELLETTITPAMTCVRQPTLVTCSGDAKVDPASEIIVKQRMHMRGATDQNWSVQFLADGLSGLGLLKGNIKRHTSGPHVLLFGKRNKAVAAPEVSGEFRIEVMNWGDAPGGVSATLPAVSPFLFANGTSRVQTIVEQGWTAAFDIKGVASAPGTYTAKVILTGVANRSEVPVELIVTERPATEPKPQANLNRVDISTDPGTPSTGKLDITNSGAGTLRGVFNTDAPWIIPPEGLFEIGPGETKTADITIDPSQRPDKDLSLGSLESSLTLDYLLPAGAAGSNAASESHEPSHTTSSVSVSVVSTVNPTLQPNVSIPALPGYGAVFIAGVGRVVGSVGQFITDMSLFSKTGFDNEYLRPLVDLQMYYTPLAGSPTHNAIVTGVTPPGGARYSDVVGKVYGADQQIGTMQIRAPWFLRSHVGAATSVFNVSNRAGTYGTAIPVFNSQFSVSGSSMPLNLVGLRKDATGHTNFYFQETQGKPVAINVDFLDASGRRLGSTRVDLNGFAATQIGSSVMPDGTVSARLMHGGGEGRFQAYATPVDRASGDTWAVADWLSINDPSFSGRTSHVIIPVAGAAPGANNTFFRTDITLMNGSGAPQSGTLRFYNRAGGSAEKKVTLAAGETLVLEDVTTKFFGITDPHVGHLVFVPDSSFSFVVITGRNYTTSAGSPGTYGTAVPPVRVRDAIPAGGKRVLGGIDDASLTTVGRRQPATFRSNLGLIETEGKPVRVKATLFYRLPTTLTTTVFGGSAFFDLAPNQFQLLGGIARTILGPEVRDSLGDLYNMELLIEVESGEGKVVAFVSSVDNGTGDSILRIVE
ncbi:MAG TPA: hypothetical protein VNL91_01175 [Thermoanaerobaculia bacterium]|nr:hypothetical protein [Thermoanaerobaculia bacterium]